MSTEIGTIEGPHDVALTQYFGGDKKGPCIQVTGGNCDGEVGYIGLTPREAYEAVILLVGWIKQLSNDRAEELHKSIIEHRELEKTVVAEAVACERFISDLKVLDIPLKLLDMFDGGAE